MSASIRMSTTNSNERLQRISELTVAYRLASIQDEQRPYFEFSEVLVWDEDTAANFCERLEVLLDRSEGKGMTMQNIEQEMTKFVQTMLLHCVILFGDETQADSTAEMYTFPEDEGARAVQN